MAEEATTAGGNLNRSGYGLVATVHPTLEPECAGLPGWGSLDWSRDHLLRCHGWTPGELEKLGKFSGEHHLNEHADGVRHNGQVVTSFPIVHGHLVVPDDLKALGTLLGAVEMMLGDDVTETRLSQARLALGKTLALMAVAGG